MIKINLVFILLITVFSQASFGITREWAEKIINGENIRTVIDCNGNLFVSGDFEDDTVFFNNGIFLKKNDAYATYSFIAKYNNKGICLWATKISGYSINKIESIALDRFENIFISGGSESDTLYFNNEIKLIIDKEYCGFIAKYDSNGLCQWADKISEDRYNYVISIAIDKNNDLIAIWDSGDHPEFTNVFIAKFNENRELIWKENLNGEWQVQNYSRKISIDSSNNIYILGDFRDDSLKFNNSKYLVNKGNSDVFICKYNPKGICQWAESIAGIDNEYANDFVVDKNGNVYVIGIPGGSFGDTEFKNGKRLSSNYGNYFAKYNTDGSLLWVEQFVGLGNITIDKEQNIYLLGQLDYEEDSVTFNNGQTLYRDDKFSVYIANFDSKGDCNSASLIPCDGNFYKGFIFDKKNNFYISGNYFVAKYNIISTYLEGEQFQFKTSISPNPAKDFITINLNPSEGFDPSEGSVLEIYDMLGVMVISEPIHPMTSSHRMNIENLPEGVYFIKIGDRVEKFVKM